ncbi:hypothetical protein AVEN_181293-1 [Araneus ventricosus]|uniref:Uncharacterized protein n=1 Tax=Araneus ventricosus TaxID=182803 RepID=A0A4Y2UTY1_ARAVE|nr:hypothetical protein AVEN_181293-1 [Araneus ventricosus]
MDFKCFFLPNVDQPEIINRTNVLRGYGVLFRRKNDTYLFSRDRLWSDEQRLDSCLEPYQRSGYLPAASSSDLIILQCRLQARLTTGFCRLRGTADSAGSWNLLFRAERPT